MTRYIGLDAHSESCTLVVVGEKGTRLKQERLETSADLLKAFIRKVPRPRHLCMEEGNLSEWLYEELEPLVDKCVVVVPSKERGNKSDMLDAWKRADELRRDVITNPVYKSPGRLRALREAMRAHCVLQRDKVRAKVRIHALCRGCGRGDQAKALYQSETRIAALDQLPAHYRSRAALYCEELDGLTRCALEGERWLLEEAARVPIVNRLATVPGIGLIRASYIAAITITPDRFRTSRQFWSYCGLAIVTRSSSDWERGAGGWSRKKVHQTRGLNHNRHPLLKSVFKGAAMTVASHSNTPLGQDYERMLQNTKPNLAQLTLARKLAAIVLAMWKHGQDYDPSKLRISVT